MPYGFNSASAKESIVLTIGALITGTIYAAFLGAFLPTPGLPSLLNGFNLQSTIGLFIGLWITVVIAKKIGPKLHMR